MVCCAMVYSHCDTTHVFCSCQPVHIESFPHQVSSYTSNKYNVLIVRNQNSNTSHYLVHFPKQGQHRNNDTMHSDNDCCSTKPYCRLSLKFSFILKFQFLYTCQTVNTITIHIKSCHEYM